MDQCLGQNYKLCPELKRNADSIRTLFETWIEHEKELEKLLDELVNMDEDVKHRFRLFQIKCQRDELKAIKNELKNN